MMVDAPITVSVLPDWPHSPPTVPDMAPVWTVRQDPSAFTGLMDVFVTVASDDPVACGSRRRASLILRCLDDRTSALIGHDCETPPSGADGWPIELRLDDGPIAQADWLPDARGETFGQWTYRDARTFMETLIPSERLHVRFADLHGVTSEMSFPVGGLAEALEPLRQACGWSERPPWMAPEAGEDPVIATSAASPPGGTDTAAKTRPGPSQAAGQPWDRATDRPIETAGPTAAPPDRLVLHDPDRPSVATGPLADPDRRPRAIDPMPADRLTGDGTAGARSDMSGARWLSSGSANRPSR